MGMSLHRRYDMSIRASRGEMRRDFASSLGLLAVLFNLLASIVFAANPASADGLIAAQDDRIVICTTPGRMVFDAAGQPVGHDGAAPHAECVFCLPLMNGAGAPAVADFAATIRIFTTEADRSGAATVVAPRSVLSAANRSRAPPAISTAAV